MCTVSKKLQAQAAANAAQPTRVPQIVDGSEAARNERALRRRRSGLAGLYKARSGGGRMGDLSAPSLATKMLMAS